MLKGFLILGGLVTGISLISETGFGFELSDLSSQVQYYDARYNLDDPFSKVVDNHGNGFDSLYGTRNVRAVLSGVYYRGGANNAFDKYGKRNNKNPLPTMGLDHLCSEGFTDAIYLYPTRYSTAPGSVSCRSQLTGASSTLKYSQISALSGNNEHALLKLIGDHINGKRRGLIYAHCWNGWHAAGYVAAITLRQYCGWSAAQAVSYWIKNTDGNSAGHASVISSIQNFKHFADLSIDLGDAKLICPQP